MGTDFSHDVIGAAPVFEYADQMRPHSFGLLLATDEVITLDFEFQLVSWLDSECITNILGNGDLALARQLSSHGSKSKESLTKSKDDTILNQTESSM